jgi:hypothetical protein
MDRPALYAEKLASEGADDDFFSERWLVTLDLLRKMETATADPLA